MDQELLTTVRYLLVINYMVVGCKLAKQGTPHNRSPNNSKTPIIIVPLVHND